MGRLTLILGGARSGKSDHAQRLAATTNGPVLFIATAQPLDEEMQRRAAAHREGRPQEWRTLELPASVARQVAEHEEPVGVVILDCLTLLVSNVMLQSSGNVEAPKEAAARRAVEEEIGELADIIQRSPAEWIVVSNEVGLGVVPAFATGRLFRDLLGWANKEMARQADEVIWMVAGIPVPIGRHRLPNA